MKKSDIIQMDNTDLLISFNKLTVQLVKEANSRRGETLATSKQMGWVVEECIKRFDLDQERLKKNEVF